MTAGSFKTYTRHKLTTICARNHDDAKDYIRLLQIDKTNLQLA